MGPTDNGTKSQPREKLEKVVIRFAGDSGDGMQLTGDRFTSEAALFGNDLATQPNYPAEIRAPQGTLPGVSSFQIQIADYDILTAGDRPDVLVAMNPAALKANIGDLPRGGLVIANSDEFTKRNLAKVGYESNPLENDELADYNVQAVAMTSLTLGAVEEIGASKKDGQRAKNMFALGLLSWMYGRPIETSETFIREKFARKPDVADANVLALKAGWNYGETTEAFATTYEVAPAKLKSGEYRQISGNTALAYGLVAAGHLADLQVMLGSYPITPASDILHELSKHKNFNVLTFQAEDEIAGIGSAIGASYGGALGVTTTSGPGISLKSEAIGLAVMTELPLVVIDVQRGGPSTGLPTKTEQADLLQAMFGRNGESPVAVLAPRSPSDCFDIAVEAVRIAIKYHTPVIVLSDGAIANGSEPWRIPDITSYPAIEHAFVEQGQPFQPYARDPQTLARQFAIPGTPGMEHRIGGLESANGSGNISYDPANHDLMVRLRQEKIAGIEVPDLQVDDPTGDAELLLLGWGSSYGPIGEACRRARRKGIKVAHAHLQYLNPFPGNLEEVLKRYPTVVAPEMNLGQLALLLRGRFLVDVQSVTKVQGMAFLADEIEGVIDSALDGTLAEKESDKAKLARLGAVTIDASGVGVDA
ncbi:2-oxoacid:acceptor oxidoreductase subunit alpha [Mycolicibacterium tokaiense]|uniref:2-oxoacid:acceptor oxidoreductase, alpha subunit n=1 Tax=Mycolicibacterium tokaiense TaxID=39695 RepID=A0A378TLF3_9MYCO|nr:2-oxoacid:acceptor oxidoreductase subunit alpha [Mycolicibacterium tokaiense]BBY90228.1 2-oxoglutarate ferredoxin oxidoreductase subunit alpha [Mycolicibacterium tokaiense]STZ61384.1 2-oxoacid:acceptor oxidoreductase, alpha subunit [Mycolicibacterium tokaiense]